MKCFFAIILAILFGQNIFATAQLPDFVLYKGNKYKIFSNPLDPYFEENFFRRPEGTRHSPALWRGYIATFEIKNKELLLNDIAVESYDGGRDTKAELRSVIKDVFPFRQNIKINWFSGKLIIPQGKMVEYDHSGYCSLFEKYILLEIDKGDFINENKVDLKEYKKIEASIYPLCSEARKINSPE